jgi:hypothetical protein
MSIQSDFEAAWLAATTPEGRSEALQDAIDLCPGAIDDMRCPLTVPFGDWTLADHDNDGACVKVSNAVLLSLGGSRIHTPYDVHGFWIKGPNAQYARIADGAIAFDGSASHEGRCIKIQAHGVQVANVRTIYGDVGIEITNQNEHQFNANCCTLRDVVIANARVGLRLAGADSNAGTFTGVEINGDGLTSEIGILDESFLGNTFIGTHIATVSQHAYICTQPANYSTHVGTYIEANCGYELTGGFEACVSSQPRVTFVGGGAIPVVDVGDRIGLGMSRVSFQATTPDGGAIQVNIPDVGVNATMTYARLNSSGLVRDGGQWRWVDGGFMRYGCHVYTGAGYTGSAPVPGNGLSRAMGYTSSGHARGLGHAIHGATQTDNLGELLPKKETP